MRRRTPQLRTVGTSRFSEIQNLRLGGVHDRARSSEGELSLRRSTASANVREACSPVRCGRSLRALEAGVWFPLRAASKERFYTLTMCSWKSTASMVEVTGRRIDVLRPGGAAAVCVQKGPVLRLTNDAALPRRLVVGGGNSASQEVPHLALGYDVFCGR